MFFFVSKKRRETSKFAKEMKEMSRKCKVGIVSNAEQYDKEGKGEFSSAKILFLCVHSFSYLHDHHELLLHAHPDRRDFQRRVHHDRGRARVPFRLGRRALRRLRSPLRPRLPVADSRDIHRRIGGCDTFHSNIRKRARSSYIFGTSVALRARRVFCLGR